MILQSAVKANLSPSYSVFSSIRSLSSPSSKSFSSISSSLSLSLSSSTLSASSSSSPSTPNIRSFHTNLISQHRGKALPTVSTSSSSSQSSSTSLINNDIYSMPLAIRLLQAIRCGSPSLSAETVDIAINLNLDPRKPNQTVKTMVMLPHGSGKKLRIAVFCKGPKIQEALAAGADMIGDQQLIDHILAGRIQFDRLIATPDMMGMIGKVARVLGPRQLMPNPKLGTVTNDLTKAVSEAKSGQIQLKTDKFGIIHCPIGKITYSPDHLIENVTAILTSLNTVKPIGAKGKYIKSVFISSTQGPSIPLDIGIPPFKLAKLENKRVNATATDATKPKIAVAASQQ